ncbi:heterokaryon incompatibility protein-domain-containing protein [Podospora conica]|nr:heterokaryon incompatibility protein-domain-containing protein [Schizothecium conicum]
MDSRKFIAESQQSYEDGQDCAPNGAGGGRMSMSRKRGSLRSEAVTSTGSDHVPVAYETTRSHHTRSESATTQAFKPVDDEWTRVVDNDFASAFFYHLFLTNDVPECQLPFSTGLCKLCNRFRTTENLRDRLHPCASCQADPLRSSAVKERMSFLWASTSLRVCVPPSENPDHQFQIGFPTLPGPLSRVRFELFKKWLDDCDDCHFECRREDGLFQPSLEAPESPEMPSRLVDVSNPNEALLRLRLFPRGSRPRNQDTRYLALSHCWGRPSAQRKQQFCTTAMNIGSRVYNGFYSSSLPQTFQDAVTATQRLGIPYLWIDALCIIQEGDGLADLRQETARIGSVFRNAYCTLAASAATSCDDGFLLPAPGPPNPIIKLGPSVWDKTVYVTKNEDNFYEDVELAPLSQCSWVLQERALSRRTIHFSARQAYFECGHGVRCETLSLLKSNRPRPFSDPDFPRSLQLLSTPRAARVSTIQSLFALYTRLDFTMPTDRAVGLAGLEARLASVLGTRCTFGIMEEYMHRCLLWRRARSATVGTVQKSVDRIPYDEHTPVPSWSWMAYGGEIIFLKIDTDMVEWNTGLQLDIPEASGAAAESSSRPVLRAQVLPFVRGCELEKEGETSWFVFANKRMSGDSGWLMWDRKPSRKVDLAKFQVVVVGRKKVGRVEGLIPGSRTKQRYYVLVVAPVGGDVWERVGVGWVPGGCISFKGDGQLVRDVV